mmetsp:Transcript_5733/g.13470  ORF Transcript_5733/g.13470 Transcript_5733/m.13470 type:complete len:321 (-) Transcript_5733:442-1404(-)
MPTTQHPEEHPFCKRHTGNRSARHCSKSRIGSSIALCSRRSQKGGGVALAAASARRWVLPRHAAGTISRTPRPVSKLCERCISASAGQCMQSCAKKAALPSPNALAKSLTVRKAAKRRHGLKSRGKKLPVSLFLERSSSLTPSARTPIEGNAVPLGSSSSKRPRPAQRKWPPRWPGKARCAGHAASFEFGCQASLFLVSRFGIPMALTSATLPSQRATNALEPLPHSAGCSTCKQPESRPGDAPLCLAKEKVRGRRAKALKTAASLCTSMPWPLTWQSSSCTRTPFAWAQLRSLTSSTGQRRLLPGLNWRPRSTSTLGPK